LQLLTGATAAKPSYATHLFELLRLSALRVLCKAVKEPLHAHALSDVGYLPLLLNIADCTLGRVKEQSIVDVESNLHRDVREPHCLSFRIPAALCVFIGVYEVQFTCLRFTSSWKLSRSA
jgi:hypothetical protein